MTLPRSRAIPYMHLSTDLLLTPGNANANHLAIEKEVEGLPDGLLKGDSK